MDETLKTFLDTIQRRSQEEIDAMNEAGADDRAKRTESIRREAQTAAARYETAAMGQVRSAGRLRLAARQAENRRRLLAFRQECAAETLRAVREKIAVYTAGSEYGIRLAELAERAYSSLGRPAEAVVYLRREDMGLADALRRRIGDGKLTFAEGDFGLGGVIVAAPELGQRVDMSFDTGLWAVQDRFGELSGLEL